MRPQEIVELGLALLGPERGTVLVEHDSSANLRWANSSLTTNGILSEQRVHVVAHPRVEGGIAVGTASADIRTTDDLAALVASAMASARASGRAEDAAPEIPARPESGDWEQEPAMTAPDELHSVGALLGEVLPHGDVDHFGYAEHTITSSYLGTTGGLRLRHDQPTARFELCGKSAGRTRSAWAGRSGRHFADMDLATTAEEVRAGLAAQATRIEVAPGRHRVILSPSAASDMLIYLLWSASARDAVEGRSAFSRPGGGTIVGDRLSPLPFWLRSDPRADGVECAGHVQSTVCSSSSSAFDVGMPIGATDWIHGGTLSSLVTTRHSAALAGIRDSPAVDNLLAGVSECSGTLEEMAARVGDGLLVTCLWYIREVDAQSLLLTGLTRDGVYVVRDGQVVGSAGNFRFNESPLGMLERVVDAGSPVGCLPREWADWFTRCRVAPLAVEGFNLSTTSEAI